MDDTLSTAISFPGADWRMHWIDGGLANLRLDVVGFLAILGEESVKRTSHLASLSRLFWLPRLLPAPHSIIYPERPENFEVVRAKVLEIHSGHSADSLKHTTAALIGSQLRPFEVRCLTIQSIVKPPKGRSGEDEPAVEATVKVKSALLAPVILVNLFGFALSLALLTLSLIYGDGMSLLATILLSILSSIVGLTNHWEVKIPPGPRTRWIPPGDAIVKYPNGGFLVLKCNIQIARELLFSPDAMQYTLAGGMRYISLSAFGTISLMISVIALANARIQLQIAWAAAYVLLNIGHWVAAALPRRLNFRFPGYTIEEEFLSDGSQAATYTDAMWKVILFAKSTRGFQKNGFVPELEVWSEWLAAAEEASKHAFVEGDNDQSVEMQEIHDRNAAAATPGLRRRIWSVPDWNARDNWAQIYRLYMDRQDV